MPRRVQTEIDDVVLLEPDTYGDERGFLVETFRGSVWRELGVEVPEFVQDNHSRSTQWTLRGLHFQTEPGQAKLVRCVARQRLRRRRRHPPRLADVRPLGRARARRQEHRQLFVPAGFAHGFLVLSEIADVAYKLSSYYDPATESGFAWDDPEVGVEWPLPEGVEPQLSERDRSAPRLSELATRSG